MSSPEPRRERGSSLQTRLIKHRHIQAADLMERSPSHDCSEACNVVLLAICIVMGDGSQVMISHLVLPIRLGSVLPLPASRTPSRCNRPFLLR